MAIMTRAVYGGGGGEEGGEGEAPKTASELKDERKRRRAIEKKLKAQGKASAADQANARVTVTKLQRSKRKFIVTVRGLESFGVKLKDAAKKLGKRFACGASVSKETEAGVKFKHIVIQGDVTFDINDVLMEFFKIPSGRIIMAEDQMKKKKGKGR